MFHTMMVSQISMLESNHQLKCNFESVHFFLVHLYFVVVKPDFFFQTPDISTCFPTVDEVVLIEKQDKNQKNNKHQYVLIQHDTTQF